MLVCLERHVENGASNAKFKATLRGLHVTRVKT